jgi:hypothetical protein
VRRLVAVLPEVVLVALSAGTRSAWPVERTVVEALLVPARTALASMGSPPELPAARLMDSMRRRTSR